MKIRNAELGDLAEVRRVYETARAYMIHSGNPYQWANGYPTDALLRADIEARSLYVVETDAIHAVFFFAVGEDPTYQHIYDGAWRCEGEYGVIHRVGSDGILHGVMATIADFCAETIQNLRIDTHEVNHTMKHVLEKCGFAPCGTIFLPDGSPRIAFQRC